MFECVWPACMSEHQWVLNTRGQKREADLLSCGQLWAALREAPGPLEEEPVFTLLWTWQQCVSPCQQAFIHSLNYTYLAVFTLGSISCMYWNNEKLGVLVRENAGNDLLSFHKILEKIRILSLWTNFALSKFLQGTNRPEIFKTTLGLFGYYIL